MSLRFIWAERKIKFYWWVFDLQVQVILKGIINKRNIHVYEQENCVWKQSTHFAKIWMKRFYLWNTKKIFPRYFFQLSLDTNYKMPDTSAVSIAVLPLWIGINLSENQTFWLYCSNLEWNLKMTASNDCYHQLLLDEIIYPILWCHEYCHKFLILL